MPCRLSPSSPRAPVARAARVFALATGLALCAGFAVTAGHASERGERHDPHDHDRARRALEAGEILPLQTILERVGREHPGQVMEVELEHKGAAWFYEVKVLGKGGALIKLKVDARDGTVLGRQEKKPVDKTRGEAR